MASHSSLLVRRSMCGLTGSVVIVRSNPGSLECQIRDVCTRSNQTVKTTMSNIGGANPALTFSEFVHTG
jgi:hypothetical protein